MGSRGAVGVAVWMSWVLAAPGGADASEFHATGSMTREYRYLGDVVRTDLGNYDRTGGSDTGEQVHFDDMNAQEQWGIHLVAESVGGPGYAEAHTYAGWNRLVSSQSQGLAYTYTATSMIEATFDDLIITSPGDMQPIPTSINFHLEGAQTVGSFLAPNNTTAHTDYLVSVEPLGAFGFFAQGSVRTINGDPQVVSTIAGPFDTPSFGGTFTTTPFMAPVNTAFSVKFTLFANSAVIGTDTDDFRLFANDDFGGTLRFVTNGPVFNDLPSGYSADSASANIAGNTFTFVPEPGDGGLAALLTLAAIALGASGRVGSHRSHRSDPTAAGRVALDLAVADAARARRRRPEIDFRTTTRSPTDAVLA